MAIHHHETNLHLGVYVWNFFQASQVKDGVLLGNSAAKGLLSCFPRCIFRCNVGEVSDLHGMTRDTASIDNVTKNPKKTKKKQMKCFIEIFHPFFVFESNIPVH